MKRKNQVLLGSLIAVAMLMTGCSSSSGSSGSTYKIGVATPLTGTNAQDGQAILNGVQIAVEEANAAGGIDGHTIEIIQMDDKGDPSEAATVANKLSADANVLAVVGHYNSSCTLAGAPIYNQNKLVSVSPGSSAASVSEAGDYTFRVITTDAVQGDYLVDWGVNELGYRKFAIVYENTDYGLGLKQVAKECAATYGAEVVVDEAYTPGDSDFSTILTKIANSDADVLFIGGLYNETALIAKQMANYGLSDLQIMGVDAIFSTALVELGGDAVNGILLTGYFSDASTSKVTQNFISSYTEKYGSEPGTYAAYGYDAALVILDALENGATDREAIQAYLMGIEGFEGATGTMSFDENGDVIKEPLKLILKDGKFTLYE